MSYFYAIVETDEKWMEEGGGEGKLISGKDHIGIHTNMEKMEMAENRKQLI